MLTGPNSSVCTFSMVEKNPADRNVKETKQTLKASVDGARSTTPNLKCH